jgi:hypothetical protein
MKLQYIPRINMQAPRVILVKICNEDSTILGMLNPHLQQKFNIYVTS